MDPGPSRSLMVRERRHHRDLKPALPGMDHGLRQRAPHRRAARPHHSPCPYPGDERRELPAQAEPVTTPATVRITPRLTPWAHRPLPRAGRRQPRGGRIAPRAGPSRGLPGQAATEPVGHFCAAAPVHFYAAVDIGGDHEAVILVEGRNRRWSVVLLTGLMRRASRGWSKTDVISPLYSSRREDVVANVA